MKQPLRQAIHNKLSRHKLTSSQLADLQNKLAHQATEVSNRRRFLLRTAGLVASCMLVAVLAYVFYPQKQAPVQLSMAQKIANEVVKNHFNLKPLEVHTNNIDGLLHYFTQLDFLIRPSRQVGEFRKSLVGGRYCSLQGITAAQLRLHMPKSKHTDTLYQTEYRAEVFGPLPDIDKQQTPLVAWSRGIKVRIWVEKGIVFALTDVAASNR